MALLSSGNRRASTGSRFCKVADLADTCATTAINDELSLSPPTPLACETSGRLVMAGLSTVCAASGQLLVNLDTGT